MKKSACSSQHGLTMVEFMVGLMLSMLISLAAISLYTVVGQSYRTVDASQQLNDNARYAFEVIGQAARSAGYRDFMPVSGWPVVGPVTTPIQGYTNSKVNSVTDVADLGGTNRGGVNGSDSLAIQFFGSSLPANIATADDSVVNCQGVSVGSPSAVSELGLSLFWVALQSDGEPALECLVNQNYWQGSTPTARNSQPVVRGVEVFKLMYAVDSVGGQNVPNKWVDATAVTNWKNVYAIRVGLVLRGPPGSAQSAPATASDGDYYPLGQDFTGSGTANGLKFSPAFDGRLRRAYSAIFLVRNELANS